MVKGKIEAIKAARLERGWSLSELAKQVNMTKETVARIERGCSAYPATAKKVADALGRPVAELFAIPMPYPEKAAAMKITAARASR